MDYIFDVVYNGEYLMRRYKAQKMLLNSGFTLE